jgi:hypothetical protein
VSRPGVSGVTGAAQYRKSAEFSEGDSPDETFGAALARIKSQASTLALVLGSWRWRLVRPIVGRITATSPPQAPLDPWLPMTNSSSAVAHYAQMLPPYSPAVE